VAGDFAKVLEGRLAALSRAAARVGLKRLLEQELGDPSRYTLDGPDIDIQPDWAFALSLLLHELASNAWCHGSLSTPEGRVDVRWHIEDSDLVLSWQESGGAPARRPTSPGVGHLLVSYAAVKLKGSANILYLSPGLRCDIRVSLLARWPQRRGAVFLGSRERDAHPAYAM
jgi:two-component sensor histidine kinase